MGLRVDKTVVDGAADVYLWASPIILHVCDNPHPIQHPSMHPAIQEVVFDFGDWAYGIRYCPVCSSPGCMVDRRTGGAVYHGT